MSEQRSEESATLVLSSSPASLHEADAPPLLDVQFRKRFAAKSDQFLLDVAFQAFPGFTILFGPSGAGKTTVLGCVSGLATPDSGRIALSGRALFDARGRINLPTEKRRV